mgnify:CR=1 FL=1
MRPFGHIDSIKCESDRIVKSLTDGDFTEAGEPFALFERWFSDATASEPNDPNAMALATVDPDGLPNVRMVLMKGWDEAGFVFYTNTESAKGRELLSAQKAAMVLHWKSLKRQVRVRGPIERVSDQEADELRQAKAALAKPVDPLDKLKEFLAANPDVAKILSAG